MAVVRQPSFAAGELAPALWGRTDSPRYGAGLRLLSDFFVSKHGAAVSRPGTRFLGKAAGNSVIVSPPIVSPPQTIIAGAVVRLIPFYFSDTDSTQNYVLEFDAFGIRVWKGGLPIVDYGVISTPYKQSDLYKIRYAQSLDVLVLACAGYPPATLKRTGDTSWTYSATNFSDLPTQDAAGAAIDPCVDAKTFYESDATHPRVQMTWLVTQILRDTITGQSYETAPVRVSKIRSLQGDPWVFDYIYQPGNIVLVPDGGSFSVCLRVNNQSRTPETIHAPWWATAISPAVPNSWKVWDGSTYVAGTIVKAASGNFFQAVQFVGVNTDPDTDDGTFWTPFTLAPQTMALGEDAGMVLGPDRPVTIEVSPAGLPAASVFVASRVYRGVAGVWGLVGESTTTTFIDTGTEPDFTQSPPAGTNPFQIFDAAGTIIRTETPISCCFFEDRLVFGGTVDRPSTLFASATGNYFNFDQPLAITDADALNFTLSSRKRELLRSLIGKDKLFALTNSGLWAIDGAQGPLTPSSIDAHVHVDVGADWPAPLVVGNSIVWVRDQGTGLRAVEFDFSRGSYTGADLSFQAEHLMIGHQIVDMTHAENPFGVTWLAREDGILLSVTKGADDSVWGWARHALCLQNDGTPQKVISLCSIPEDGRDAVYLAVSDPAGGAAWILRMGQRGELDDEALSSIAGTGGGLEYGLGMGLGQGAPGSQTPSPSGFVAPGTPICLDAWSFTGSATSNGAGLFTFSGLNYLAGRQVWFIIDGNICGTNTSPPAPIQIANDGTVSVFGPWQVTHVASSVYVGLPYQPELELLDIADARTRQKAVMNVALEVLAHGKFKAGTSFADLDDQDMPTPDDDEVRLQVRANWSPGGRCCVRQVLPLPLTIRAVSREAAVGEL